MKTSVPTEAITILPGDVGQLFHGFPAETWLRAFKVEALSGSDLAPVVVADAARVEKIFAGKHQVTTIPPEGLVVPPNCIAIALVRNMFASPLEFRGTWEIETAEKDTARMVAAAVPAADAKASSAVKAAAAVAAPPAARVPAPDVDVWKKLETLARDMVVLGERAKDGTVRVVAPGTNELAVLLVRNEVQLLIELVRAGRPIEENQKWAVVRKLEESLR